MSHEPAAISVWEIVRNKKFWALPLTSSIRFCGVGAKKYVLTTSLNDSFTHSILI